MKRRTTDNAKLRRAFKKNKMPESLCGSERTFHFSSLIYFKMLLVWTVVMMADFVLDFRFEYFWPFWLMLRCIYDSFRYQGMTFTVFFVCVTFTSDVICFIFVPVQWVFFIASTYVWVHIGYPVVTLGFDVKSYVSYRLRLPVT
ncbi:macoilin [Trichinella spiralis]|uniref:macoilin n=1 Tax=Trichinella spiralis TaxID=6334 RepID=UPI0001EFD4E1|nr:macoilin [Trichinella spiralis]